MMSEATLNSELALVPSLLTTPALDRVQPDPDIWFEDGNVVVVAQQTAFRLHRGALSRHSEIFRGLFSVPQPTPSSQIMDGCPVIPVTDSSHDFKHLLRAVYDGASVFSGGGAVDFGVLAAIVRMGHKYQVDAILEEALRRLKTVFTSDFAIWEQHQGRSTALVTLRVGDAVEAVNVFLLTGRTETLASAFYMCGKLDIEELFNGVVRADGTLEQLSTHDLQRCLTAQMALLKHDAQITATVLRPDPPMDCACGSHEARRAVLDSAQEDLCNEFPEILDTLPIRHGYLTQVIECLQAEEGWCIACAEALKARHTELRRDLWGRLPGFFRLDT